MNRETHARICGGLEAKFLRSTRLLNGKDRLGSVQFLILITTYMVLDLLSLIGYAILANKLIVWLKANPKIINTISACVLLIIATILIITQQY